MDVLGDALDWLSRDGSSVAVFDATNSTVERRRLVQGVVAKRKGVNLIFLESICDNPRVLGANCLQKVQNSPDFKGMREADALADLRARIAKYERVYRRVADEEGASYIKIQDLGEKVTVRNVHGSLAMQIVHLLMNCHTRHRHVVFVRAADAVRGGAELESLREEAIQALSEAGEIDGGRSGVVVAGGRCQGPYASPSPTSQSKITGTSAAATPLSLSPSIKRSRNVSMDKGPAIQPPAQLTRSASFSSAWRSLRATALPMPITAATSYAPVSDDGKRFIERLRKYATEQPWSRTARIFSSTLPRAVETAKVFQMYRGLRSQQWSALNVLDTGVCHGMKIDEIKRRMPAEYDKWKMDPYRYRFPCGESYMDLCNRLTSVVLEIERTRRPVVVVSHLSTLQALYSYFMAVPNKLAPTVKIPRNTAIVLTPHQYGWKCKMAKV